MNISTITLVLSDNIYYLILPVLRVYVRTFIDLYCHQPACLLYTYYKLNKSTMHPPYAFDRLRKLLIMISIPLLLIGCKPEIEQIYPSKSLVIDQEYAKKISNQIVGEVSVTTADEMELSLWASDTLVKDPIAISIDEKGRIYYTRGNRLTNSEFDIRSHTNWMTASISFQTMEDRRKFIRETFAETNEEGNRFLKDLNQDGQLDWRDLTVEKEQVWFVEDLNQDGMAERTQLYIEDFHEEISDLANGVEVHDGKVFITVGPDMWSSTDRDQDGIADQVSSLSHGYAVHIGFGAHGMSGAKIGPDGRIWWGIGDIGMNVVDQDGVRWKYPNRGVVVRSELDGSGFEVYAYGVRNTHEFTFDKYGNLISVDNDGDHKGERERLVYLINGSDSGWRINWQFGKYTDPDNNKYKVWMEENLHVPHWDGQAAYILPPIVNYVNGPTGMVYNPGTALGEKWYDHFFVAEFRGTPVNSPIHAFTLRPAGASFELDQTQEVVRGLLPTGLDFGPDGALYFGDWIDGWNTKQQGRLWKLDLPKEANSTIRLETKDRLAQDFTKTSLNDLAGLLAHQDMRVRQKAQFELADRGKKGAKVFEEILQGQEDQLARIHAIWGLGMMARKEQTSHADPLVAMLQDSDQKIITQSVKTLGDIRYPAVDQMLPLLSNPSLRVQLHATEALGRLAFKPATEPILKMLEKNNDEDIWLRHAGMIALARIGDEAKLTSLSSNPSRALRLAAVVALRRMQSPNISQFLSDSVEVVVTEAARAINDDFSIPDALPDLARLLTTTPFQGEPLIRRTIGANSRIGKDENVDLLSDYILKPEAPAAMRAEALNALSVWGKPSLLDRVDGRYRGAAEKDHTYASDKLSAVMNGLIADEDDQVVEAAVRALGLLGIKGFEDALLSMIKNHQKASVRREALNTLFSLGSTQLTPALQIAFDDADEKVRTKALAIVPASKVPPKEAVALFKKILKIGAVKEQQAALSSLGEIKLPEATQILSTYMDQLLAGTFTTGAALDLIEAAIANEDPDLMEKVDQYHKSKDPEDPLSPYIEALHGGDTEKGESIFYTHEAAQCVRCHTIFETGGTMGPGLPDVGSRLSSMEILRAVVDPSGTFAEGYQMVTVDLEGGETITGLVQSETEATLAIKLGSQEVQEIDKLSITARKTIPSSMPPMGQILTKKEIRDVVAFLGTLKGH